MSRSPSFTALFCKTHIEKAKSILLDSHVPLGQRIRGGVDDFLIVPWKHLMCFYHAHCYHRTGFNDNLNIPSRPLAR